MEDGDLRGLMDELFGPEGASAAAGPFVVVGAHADDETIGASWLLARARPLTVVQLTDGAPHDATLWPKAAPETRAAYAALRRSETEVALALTGIPPERILNLGLADQDAAVGIAAAATTLAELLDRLSPRVIVTHPYEGGHPDHDATVVAVRAAVALHARAGHQRPLLIEMTSYHLHEGALRTGAFLPSVDHEAVRTLSQHERARKRRMFDCYASQQEVLGWFRIDEERYRPAQPIRLDLPPHPGVLHYETLFPMRGERFRELARGALARLDIREDELC